MCFVPFFYLMRILYIGSSSSLRSINQNAIWVKVPAIYIRLSNENTRRANNMTPYYYVSPYQDCFLSYNN